jgi:hypothetical protein
MADNIATLTLKIVADAKDAQKGLDETATSADKFHAGIKSAALPAAAALAAVGAAGLDAAKAAAEDQAAAAQLALALKNSAGASDAAVASTEDWITKTSKAAAVADDELRPALATLVRATGDVATSQDAMNVALDVSAATGTDVESVANALAKAYAGNTTSLGKMVPGMDKAVLASGDMNAIMAELARTTGGAAATAADSAAGRMEGMKIQMGEAKEAIGGALLPALSALAGLLTGVAGFIQDNTTLFLGLGAVVAVFAGSILALNVALKAYTIIQQTVAVVTKLVKSETLAANLAFLSSPVFWLIAAIVALIVVIVLIATKTTWFQDIWTTAWGAIKAAAEAVWNWLQDAASAAFNVIATLVTAYVNIYIAIWNGLVTAVQAVWQWISNAVGIALNAISSIIRGYIAIYVAIFQGIKSGVDAVWNGLKDAAITALNLILAPINAIKTAFDKVSDAIQSVINWLGKIKIPDALRNVGNLISNLNPFSATAAASSGSAAAVRGVGISAFAAPALTAGVSSRGTNAAPTIVVQGALDPVAVARQIRDILKRDDRRRSGVVLS